MLVIVGQAPCRLGGFGSSKPSSAAAGAQQEHRRCGHACKGKPLHGPEESYAVGEPTGHDRSGREAERIVRQCQDGEGGAVKSRRGKSRDHCAGRPGGSCRQKHADAEKDELRLAWPKHESGGDRQRANETIESAEQRALRRGGDADIITLDTAAGEGLPASVDVEVVNDALGDLAKLDPALARLVEMRFFGGMTEEEIAEALGMSVRTVSREWKKARALLLTLVGD